MSATWRIILTAAARAHLRGIADARVRKAVANRIETLSEEPEHRGKPLIGELAGYYSVRAAGQRYRIIYRIEHDTVVVYVVALGIRKEGDKKDIYRLAQRLLRQGLLAPETTDEGGEG